LLAPQPILDYYDRSLDSIGLVVFEDAKLKQDHSRDKVVVVHTAGSAVEAMVIRGLLQSAGIQSPGSATADPFPMSESGDAFHDADVVVLESQAEEARQIIADYLRSNEGIELENPDGSSENEPPA
jgi:hypothetical protein